MKIKGIIDCDFINYKKPCLTIEMPKCLHFKCDKECGEPVCQNSQLASAPTLEVKMSEILYLYSQDLVHALCFQGLEPFDTFEDLRSFIEYFRFHYPEDDIVIYTGYNKDEIQNQINILKKFKNIIVKFGRYIPGHQPHFDELLGIHLASDNQYAERISI